jgi:hypothetical protein
MKDICQKTIPPPREHIIRIPWFFRNVVVNEMGNDIRFLGNDLDDQVLYKKSPKGMTKRIGTVCGISVIPNSAMSPQNDHTVNKAIEKERPTEIVGSEDDKGNHKKTRTGPSKKSQPILAGF